MKCRIVIAIMLFINTALGQTYNDNYKLLTSYELPKSPNAASFEKYTTVPVSFQTGQLNYSIPLYNIETEGIHIPIVLSHNNSGLKVTEVASWVGQGWHLSVGGTITRVVKGIPDDGPFGLMEPYYADLQYRVAKNQSFGLEKYHYFVDVTKSLADTEHDVFYFDCLGIKGSFIINKYGQCVQFPRTNNKIQFTRSTFNNQLEKFSIVDENGHTYYFDLKEESSIFTLTNNVTGNTPNYFNKLKGTSWYLTRIQAKNGGEVFFDYSHYQYKKAEKTESHLFNSLAPGVPQCGIDGPGYTATYITSLVDVYQLNRVYWKNGFVNFTPGPNRQDIQSIDPNATVPYLSGISVYQTPLPFSYSPAFIRKEITFEYTEPGRLLLTRLNFRNSAFGLNDHSYEFTYYDGALPWPSYAHTSNSYNAQDYWGYYNGQISNPFMLPFNVVPDYPIPLIGGYSGPLYGIQMDPSRRSTVNRVPDPNYAQYGMLKEIKYPTGGKTRIYYEGNIVQKNSVSIAIPGSEHVVNSLQHSTDAQNNICVTLGGLRVKTMEFYSDPNAATPSTVNNIVYDQSQISTKFMPVYLSAIRREASSGCSPCGNIFLYTLNSSALVNNPAYLVEYNRVTEVQGNGAAGQTVHLYDPSVINPHVYWQAPFGEPAYLPWRGGEGGTIVQSNPGNNNVTEKYVRKGGNDPILNYAQQLDSFVTDIKVAVVRNDGCQCCVTGQFYSLSAGVSNDADAETLVNNVFSYQTLVFPTENYVTKETTEKTYSPTGQHLQKTILYNYNLTQQNRLLPNSVSSVLSNGLESKTRTSFPQDYPIANGLVYLINKNILDVPVEELRTTTKNGIEYVISARFFKYFAGRAAISAIYEVPISEPIPLQNFNKSYVDSFGTMVIDTRYDEKTTFTEIDSYDQPLEYFERETGLYNAIIWDYNRAYQVANVKNCRQVDVAYTSFEADGTGNWTIPAGVVPFSGVTGRTSYNLSNGMITKAGLTAEKKYTLSYYTQNSTPFSIAGTQGSPMEGKAIGTWRCFKHTITGVTAVSISGTGSIDELRLHPQNAQMITYTYDPLIGMTSQCDINNQVNVYEYDGLNRLKLIRDQDKNVIKTFDYQYQQQP